MRRVLLVASLWVSASACLNVKLCNTDGDCAGGGVCDPRGFCVFDPDGGAVVGGGTGGGATGGGSGGGGATGGGDADSGVGGGTGGGGEVDSGVGGGGGEVDSGVGGGAGGGTSACGCNEPYECAPDGGCEPAYRIAFVTPPDMQKFGAANNTVLFTVELTREDGGVPAASLTEVPWSISPTLVASLPPLVRDGGSGFFAAALALPAVSDSYQAIAGWTEVQAQLVFAVDRVGPVLNVDARDGGYVRDEFIAVRIRSNEQLSAAPTVTLEGLPQVFTANENCDAGAFDRCAMLDFAEPPLPGLDGGFTVSVTATDLYGNSTTLAAPVNVTRIRWRRQILQSGLGLTVRAAPALDSVGNLYVGTQDNASGRVLTISPEGVLATSTTRTSAGSVQSLSVAKTSLSDGGSGEYVYVASNRPLLPGGLALYPTDGGAALSPPSECSSVQSTWSALALVARDAGTATPVVSGALVFSPATLVVDLTPAELCVGGPAGAERATAGVAVGDIEQPQPGSSATGVQSATNLIAGGDKVLWVGASLRLNQSATNAPLSISSSAAPGVGNSAIGSGLAMDATAVYGTYTGATVPLARWFGPSHFAVETDADADYVADLFAPSLSGNSLTSARSGTGNWLLSVAAGMPITAAPAVVPAGSNGSFTTPVLGDSARTYVVQRDGRLLVYARNVTGSIAGQAPVWQGALFASGATVYAHPTLDCSRNLAKVGRPGTLYVVSSDGEVVAVVSDSLKLDATAAWPKWQRTAGNAGNPAFELNPGCP